MEQVDAPHTTLRFSLLAPLHPAHTVQICLKVSSTVQARTIMLKKQNKTKKTWRHRSMTISCNRVPTRAPWYWITDTFPNADQKRDEGAARRLPFGALREPRLSLMSPLQDKARCSSQDATVDRRETRDAPLLGTHVAPAGRPLQPCSPHPAAEDRASWTAAVFTGCAEPSPEHAMKTKLLPKGGKSLNRSLKSQPSANPVPQPQSSPPGLDQHSLPAAIPPRHPALGWSRPTPGG